MEETLTRLLLIGHCQARKVGLHPTLAEECAADFTLHMLQQCLKSPAAQHCIQRRPVWLHACAHHFALNYRRSMAHQDQSGCEQITHDECVAITFLCSTPAVQPDQAVLQTEFWTEIRALSLLLPSLQREVFTRYYVEEDTVQEIADALHKTPNAIDQTLWRARHHVLAIMQQQHITEADLRAYLAPADTPSKSR